jgi:hypothetical protein
MGHGRRSDGGPVRRAAAARLSERHGAKGNERRRSDTEPALKP